MNSKKKFLTNYAYNFFLKLGNLWNVSGFGIIYKVRSLNTASCQMADSKLSVRTSKEPELKGLKFKNITRMAQN